MTKKERLTRIRKDLADARKSLTHAANHAHIAGDKSGVDKIIDAWRKVDSVQKDFGDKSK